MKEWLFKVWGGFDLKGGVSLDTHVLSEKFVSQKYPPIRRT